MNVMRNMAPIDLQTPSLICLPVWLQWQNQERVKQWLISKGVAPALSEELVIGYHAVGVSLGINWIWAICQACRETGFWRFGGDVKPEQNNFAGLGATGNGEQGESFASVVQGILAHCHHLALYAGVRIPIEELVSDRDRDLYGVLLGRAGGGRFENLSGTWATDLGYADGIKRLVLECENFVEGVNPMPAPAPTPGPRPRLIGVTIGMDPGHSKSATGARGLGANPPIEYAMNLLQAQTAKPILEEQGASVAVFDPNPDTLSGVGRWGGKHRVFLSWHHNAANADGNDEGTEVFLPNGASSTTTKIASDICAAISKELGTTNRGVKFRDFTVIATALANGCKHPMLIESYFIDDYRSIEMATDRSVRAARAACAALIQNASLL